MNENRDLIALKSAEFSELPGMILGLDGWLLRSLPKELRGQFLTGYLKLLRIAFHPDRFSELEKKRSRENFLQAAAESVEFMCGGEYNFEITVDHVPTRKNPLVNLRNTIEAQSGIIEMSNEREAELMSKISESLRESQKNRELFSAATGRLDSMERYIFNMRMRLKVRDSEIPVPLLFKRYQIKGRWIDFARQPAAVAAMTTWAKVKSPNDISDRFERLLKSNSPRVELNFRKGRSGKFRMKSAFAPADMVELVKARLRPDEISDQSTAHTICKIGSNAMDGEESRYSLPFIYAGMILAILDQKENATRLFLCESIDAAESSALAKANAFEAELKSEKIHNSEMAKKRKAWGWKKQGEINSLKSENKKLKERLGLI